MRGVLQRARSGDRIVMVVGTLVATAITVLIGFTVLVASRVDEDSAALERSLARAELVALADRKRAVLASVARTQEAVERVFQTGDTSWLHRQVGNALRRVVGHDRIYVVGLREPLYASYDGTVVGAQAYRTIEYKVGPLLEKARETLAAELSVRATDRSGDLRPLSPVVEVGFRRIEGAPALVGAVTVVPDFAHTGQVVPSRAAVVSVTFFSDRKIANIARNLAAENLDVHQDAPPAGKIAVEIPLGPGEAPAWLAWSPRAPGAAMLSRMTPALVAMAAVLIAATIFVMLYVRRTSERINHFEHRARELAFRDRLTGLPNRVQLLETLSESVGSCRADSRLALVLVDIDNFKDINDTLGHSTGDEVLFAIGERLTTVAGSQGMAVRFGGDEFALLVPAGQGAESADAVCRQLGEVMRTPVFAGGQYLSVSGTLGVAIAPDDASDAEQLMHRAEIALHRAKSDGRASYRLFEPSLEEALQRRSAIERDLSRALANDELTLRFQPLFAADGQRMVGVEALVRWNHPERGIVPPSEFIPVAEQTGLVAKVDEWVLRHACEQARQWPHLSLAVNLSAVDFRQAHIADRIRRILEETGFDPRRLEIEITESMLLGATGEVLGELSQLRRVGARIALDDFGTGYSSLGYLRRFPVDKLKIDKSFVQNLGINEDAAAIVECVTRLGRALGLAVTAEGVESADQHRFVRAAGCHQVQGYLFAPPLEAERVTEFAAQNVSRPAESVRVLAAG